MDCHFANTRTTFVWCPEICNQVLARLSSMKAEERMDMAKQLSVRVTNLIIESNGYFDAANGSARMAVIKASARDVSDNVTARAQDLNFKGATGQPCMVSVIAPLILCPYLLLALIRLAYGFFPHFMRTVAEAFFRLPWG